MTKNGKLRVLCAIAFFAFASMASADTTPTYGPIDGVTFFHSAMGGDWQRTLGHGIGYDPGGDYATFGEFPTALGPNDHAYLTLGMYLPSYAPGMTIAVFESAGDGVLDSSDLWGFGYYYPSPLPRYRTGIEIYSIPSEPFFYGSLDVSNFIGQLRGDGTSSVMLNPYLFGVQMPATVTAFGFSASPLGTVIAPIYSSSVPEPASWALLAAIAICAGWRMSTQNKIRS